MSQYWSSLIHRLTPYVPGEQRSGDDIVKLNTNENPYPPSDKVLQAIADVTPDALRRYPDPQSLMLRQELADYHHLTPEQIFTGNGSDEILALAFMAFFKDKAPLQFPEVSYSFYQVYCNLLEIEPNPIPLLTDHSLSLEKFGGHHCGGIVFPNPNAPTAIAEPKNSIEKLLQANPDVVVLIDEAYADFGAESVIDLIDTYPNLIISRTFSKGRSLAGLRLGAAFANPALIEGLVRAKDSFNSYPVDAIAQAAGIASLKDEGYYRQTVKRILATRERVTQELVKRNFSVLPSAANFIFTSPGKGNAAKIFSELSDKNILVRYWEKPQLSDWLRITIGTDREMDMFFAALDELAYTG